MPIWLTLGDGSAPVSAYTLSGPSTAATGVMSDAFVVALGVGTLAAPVAITPSDGGAGGSFSVATVTLTGGVRTAWFRYTPVAAGSVTISVTNDGGLTDPPSIVLTVSDPVPFDPDAASGGVHPPFRPTSALYPRAPLGPRVRVRRG